MGGKAFEVELDRMPKCLYQLRQNRIMPHVGVYTNTPAQEKQTFGDLDFYSDVTWRKFEECIYKVCAVLDHKIEGKTSNFLCQDEFGKFQVDYTQYESKDAAYFAACYFSYNGIGSVLSKLAKQKGFILKPNGIFYRLNDDQTFIEDVLVTDVFEDVWLFFGFPRFDFDIKDIADKMDPAAYMVEHHYDGVSGHELTRQFFALMEERAKKILPNADFLSGILSSYPKFSKRLDASWKKSIDAKKFYFLFGGNACLDNGITEPLEIKKAIQTMRQWVEANPCLLDLSPQGAHAFLQAYLLTTKCK